MSGLRLLGTAIAIIVLNAAVQSATVAGDPDVTATPSFVVVTIVSAVVLVAAAWLLTLATFSHTAVAPIRTLHPWRLLIWMLVVAAITVVASVFVLLLVPLILFLCVLLTPAFAAGDARPLAALGHSIRTRPLLFVLSILFLVLLVAVNWLLALILGFFVTGPVAAFGTWVWFGLTGWAVLAVCARLRWPRHPRAAG